MVVGNLLTVYRVNPYILRKSTFSSTSRLDCMGCSVLDEVDVLMFN